MRVTDVLHMTEEELFRKQVLDQLVQKHIKQGPAAEQLGISVRQVKRLKHAYKRHGAKALVSQKRGRTSNHRLKEPVAKQAVRVLHERYADFGPTLAHEKLTETQPLALSVETGRQLMMGELGQIDGSPYDWFEGRAPACTLLVCIDDATGPLMDLWFTEAETTFSYVKVMESYLRHHGKPLSLYSDKLSVFRVNLPNDLSGSGTTPFTRTMYQLDLEVICANSPQAKGRVERATQSLQDRRPKAMRLRGINTMAQGNAYLPEFIQDFNRRSGGVARDSQDAHRP